MNKYEQLLISSDDDGIRVITLSIEDSMLAAIHKLNGIYITITWRIALYLLIMTFPLALKANTTNCVQLV